MQPIGEPRSGAIKHCKDLPVSQSQRKCGAEQEIEEKEDANEVKNKLSLANVTLSPLHVLLEGIVISDAYSHLNLTLSFHLRCQWAEVDNVVGVRLKWEARQGKVGHLGDESADGFH